MVSLKSGPDGKRRRKKVSGRNQTEVRAKLAELHDELNDGVVSEAGYAVAQAIRDYLADGLPGRAPKTIRTQREVLEPLLPILGNVPLRELTAADVRSALIKLATTRATRTVSMAHAALARAIRHAEAGDKVRRNVAALVDSPSGRQGRPSRSLTFEQAVALITAAREYALHAYVVLSLLVGLRTEEARALRWDHVHLDADPGLPPHVDVWRSVRAHGDVKTSRSRRSLALPVMAVEALAEHQERQARARLRAGELWQEQGLVFTTALGTRLDAGNVRRSLRAICRKAGIGESWTPRELRHTFVSLLSGNGMAIEDISHLVGHSSTLVTQTVYRHELRPVVTSGAEMMDRIFDNGGGAGTLVSDLHGRARNRLLTLPGHFAHPVRVDAVKEIAPSVYLLKVRVSSGQPNEKQVTGKESEHAPAEQGPTAALSDAPELFRWVEGQLIKLSLAHDPLFAVSISGVRGLSHQIEPSTNLIHASPTTTTFRSRRRCRRRQITGIADKRRKVNHGILGPDDGGRRWHQSRLFTESDTSFVIGGRAGTTGTRHCPTGWTIATGPRCREARSTQSITETATA